MVRWRRSLWSRRWLAAKADMSVFVSVPWEKSPDVERVVVGLGHKENPRKDLHVAI